MNFDNLLLREVREQELILEHSGMKAEVICDPTLVLNGNTWRGIAKNGLTPDKPFVPAHLLGDLGKEADQVFLPVTYYGEVPVVHLSDRQKPGDHDPGPAEFISL